jgi:hypothetical protein
LSFFKETNFSTFKIENFLSEEQYITLYKNIPDIPISEFKKYNPDFDNQSSEHKLKAFISEVNAESYEKHIYKNNILNEFVQTIKSAKMIEILLKNFFMKVILSRRKDMKTLFKLLIRKNKPILNKSNSMFDRFFYNQFITTVSFVYMAEGAQLFPHTDGMKKILTLMLYFPDEDYCNNSGHDLEIGTTFYNSDEYGLAEKDIKSKIKNIEDVNDFKKRNSVSLKFPFKKKNIYGFIKSHNSWHGLEPLQIHKNFIRKNININLLLV